MSSIEALHRHKEHIAKLLADRQRKLTEQSEQRQRDLRTMLGERQHQRTELLGRRDRNRELLLNRRDEHRRELLRRKNSGRGRLAPDSSAAEEQTVGSKVFTSDLSQTIIHEPIANHPMESDVHSLTTSTNTIFDASTATGSEVPPRKGSGQNQQ